MKKQQLLITCAKGIAPWLAGELRELGFPVLSEETAGIGTEGTAEDIMMLNLSIRTGQRVLSLFSRFTAYKPEELYNEIIRLPWEKYISDNGYITVTSTVDNPYIRDSRFANQKCKDAIVDRILRERGKRPDSGPERRGVVIHLHWEGKECSIYFDTSGESLAKRGYRKLPHKAPMQETLASAVIDATNWDRNSIFINPMCGSGTLAIEAALIGLNRPPGLFRENFGFMHLKDFDAQKWGSIKNRALSAVKKSLPFRIIATDISEEAITRARKNAAEAGVEKMIDFRVCRFEDTEIPEGGGIVIINPEYGERLGSAEELEATYKAIGDFFKQKCSGYTGYIFTGNLALAKKVGLRTKSRKTFYNAQIECRLLEYELYSGSRKQKD